MAIKTTLEQLEAVQAAIAAIETGAQSYGSGDRRLTKGDLATLYKREEKLLARYRIEQGTGGPAINTGVHRRDY